MNDLESICKCGRKYVRKNKIVVFPILNANMGIGKYKVPIVVTETRGFRKLI